jgi:hypothetical protein
VVNRLESTLTELATAQGLWAVLSIFLLFYIMKKQDIRDQKQDEREMKYQDIIQSLTDQLSIVKEIKQEVSDIKSNLLGQPKHVDE